MAGAKQKSPKRDYAQEVADRLIAQLKEGTAPWQKPWAPGELSAPMNPVTGKAYRGANSVWLMMQGRADNRWLTYRQAEAAGAQVRKGEKGTLVQYWIWREDRPVTDASGKPVIGENGKPLKQSVELERPKVMSSVVFNAEQIDGLPDREITPLAPERERHERAERMLSASPAEIRHVSGDRAYYSPREDRITLPRPEQFTSMDGYYATALHEVAHSTGHESRLGRDLAHPFGSEGYAKEELRAEIASLMLGEELGIGHDPGQHASYVGAWIRVLENDPKEIFRAAADADKIRGFMLTLEREREQAIAAAELEHKRFDPLEPPSPVIVAAERAAAQVVNLAVTADRDAVEKGPEQMRTSDKRVNLHVPYSAKEQAKAAGARWDKQGKTWYAPPGSDLDKLAAWTSAQPTREPDPTSVALEFAAAIREAGILLPNDALPIMDGQWHRHPVEGDKKGARSGSYKGFTDGHPAGVIRNFLNPKFDRTWKSEVPVQSLTAEQRQQLHAESQERQAARAAALLHEHKSVATQIKGLLDGCPPAPADHPYLAKKNAPAYGVHINTQGVQHVPAWSDEPMAFSGKGELLIPVRDVDGQIWGAQSIRDDGRKSFPRGCRLAGMFHMIGDIENAKAFMVCEGYATGAKLHEASSLPVAVAFNANNLLAVAKALAERYPDHDRFIAGDNDHRKEAQGKDNVGKRKALEAAQEVGGAPLIPEFSAADKGTDWDDLGLLKGLDAVRAQLVTQMAIAERHQLAAEIREEREQAQVRSRQHDSEERELVRGKERGGPTLPTAERKRPELVR